MSVGCIAQLRTSAKDTKDKLGYLAIKFNKNTKNAFTCLWGSLRSSKNIKIIMKKPIDIKIFMCAQQ